MDMTEEIDSELQGLAEDVARSAPDHREFESAALRGDEGRSIRVLSFRRAAPYFVVLYVLISGIVWSAVTPPGGVPDEPAHLVYAAAVVRNDFGEPVPVDQPPFSMLMSHA